MKIKLSAYYTHKECYDILKELIMNHKADNRTYKLILLWLVGLFNKKQYSHIKTLSKGSISIDNINKNTDEIIELVHEIILELLHSKEYPDGSGSGLKYRINWDYIEVKNKKTGDIDIIDVHDGNEGRVVSYIYSTFMFILYRSLAKSYRGDVSYTHLTPIKKSPEMQELRARMEVESDTGITTPDLIHQLKDEGFSDELIYQYRYIYSLGYSKTIMELTEEIETRSAVIDELNNLTDTDKYSKQLYEIILDILNSHSMPKINRELLKCYYKIPTVITVYGKKKSFTPTMLLFFEMYPDYKKVLKVKRISYNGKRVDVRWVNNESIIESSEIFKESLSMLEELLKPELAKFHDSYLDNISSARELLHAYNNINTIGEDLYFKELTSRGLK